MKKILILLLFIGFLSCNDTVDDNQLLPYELVDFTINLNLTEGTNLNFNGGQAEFVNRGLRGVLIIRRSDTVFDAYEMACPHIVLQNCSKMTYDSLFMTCPCDGERFQLINDGIAENGDITETLRNYRVVRSGNILRVTN